jgi:hypothetical protein
LHCNTFFITEKVINNHNTFVTNNTQNNTNIERASIGTLNVNAGPDVGNLLKKAQMEMEDGNFDEARETLSLVEHLNIEIHELWLYSFLAYWDVKDLHAFREYIAEDCTQDSNYKKAMRFGNNEQKAALKAAVDAAYKNLQEENKQKEETEERNRLISEEKKRKERERDEQETQKRRQKQKRTRRKAIIFIVAVAVVGAILMAIGWKAETTAEIAVGITGGIMFLVSIGLTIYAVRNL